MRNGLFGAVAALMAGAGLVWGQEPPIGPFPIGGGEAPGMQGPIGYPPPANPEGLATNDVRSPNVWFGAEYLGWYSKRARTNFPLVTTGSTSQGGVIGASTTNVLYQGPDGHDFFSGGRFTGGIFFAGDNRFGAEFSIFVLGEGDSSYTAASQGSGVPLLARPYINQTTGQATTAILGSTAIGPGKVSVGSNTQLWGADAHWMLNLFRTAPNSPWGFNMNLFAGMSFLSLRETVGVVSSTDYFLDVVVPFNGSTFTSGQSISTSRRLLSGTGTGAIFLSTTTESSSSVATGMVDLYRTSNQFYGGEFGFSNQIRYGRWGLGFTGKISVGVVHSSVEVQGYSTLSQTGNDIVTVRRLDFNDNTIQTLTSRNTSVKNQTVVGGLYAVNGQIGRQTDNSFAFMPEGTLSLNYQFTQTITGTLGYNFLYLNRVVRAPQVVNPTVDPTLIPTNSSYGTGTGSTPQGNLLPYSSYWVQGINAGLSIQY